MNLLRTFWTEAKATWHLSTVRDRINVIALTLGIPALAFLSLAIGAAQ